METLITLCTAVAALVASVATLIKVVHTSSKIQEIHLSLNSRLDQFLALTRKSSHAEGVKDEQDRPK